MNNDIAISVKNVSKDFVLPHEKVRSVKGLFTKAFNRNKSYEKQHVLKDISFEIKKGEFFGIVGRNGSGKSTLLKIIAGIYQPSRGSVKINGRLVPFIELGVGFSPDLSGRENVYLNGAMLGFSKKEVDEKYNQIVDFAELEKFMDQKLKNFSSGMQVRLAFSVATVLAESDILLIDEVLAVGDADFQRKCFEYFQTLKLAGKSVIFVSHDMSAVEKYCDRAVLIENMIVELIDKAPIVAQRYSDLFQKNHNILAKKRLSNGRIGDGHAVFDATKSELVIINGREWIRVTARIKFNHDVEEPIFGFSIKPESFMQLTGMNTLLKNIKVPSQKKGTKINIEWMVPNVFNKGVHYVDLNLAHDNTETVSDRWAESSTLIINRKNSAPYPILLTDDIKFMMKGIK